MKPARRWSPDALRKQSQRLEDRPPQAVLRWALGAFGRVAQGTGFGPSGVALMHMLSRLQGRAAGELTFFFLDTGVLFDETYALRERLEARLGVRVRAVEPRLSLQDQANVCGEALWDRAPDQCCHLRKVRPLRRVLRGHDAWITGVRRDQAATRAQAPVAAWHEGHGVAKLNPLATWTRADVWKYIERHALPYNPLHDRGYPSIGCQPCTQPAAAAASKKAASKKAASENAVGENTTGKSAASEDPEGDLRAGRWTGQEKTECGLHVSE